MSLRTKAIHGAKWQIAGVAIQAVFSLITLAIFGRLISQEAFGQFAIINVILLFIISLTEFGFGASIVQLKEYNKYHLHFAFYASLALGLISSLFLISFAPSISKFYDNKVPIICIQLLSLNLFVKSLGVVSNALLVRRFHFKVLFYAILYSNIIGNLIIGIYLAYNGFEIWALIIALLTTSIIQVIISIYKAPHSIRLKFQPKENKAILSYGTGLTSLRILSQIGNTVDKLILGKFFPMSAVGIYDKAFNVASLPKSYIAKSIDGVLFSTMSRSQDRSDHQQMLYLNSLSLIGLLTVSFTTVLLFFPEQVITVLLSDKWIEAAPLLQVFGIYAFLIIFIRFSDTLVRAENKLWGSTLIKFIFAVLKTGLILSFIHTDLLTIATLAVIAYTIHAILMLGFTSKIINLPWYRYIKALAPVFIVGIIFSLKNILFLQFESFIGHDLIFLLIVGITDLLILGLCYLRFPMIFGRSLYDFVNSMAVEIKLTKQILYKLQPFMKWQIKV